MPIYEYECKACKARHEVIQRFSDAPPAHCPKCGGDMRKLASSPAIQFKGSGFYKTDYAGSGSKSEPKGAESKGEIKSESKSETKTDTKSETKTDTKSESKASE